MIADTILHVICIVSMRRSEYIPQVFIVLRMLICVAHDEAYGRSCCLILKDTTQYFHLIGLFSGCGKVRLPWTPACKLALDKVHINLYAGRHTVNNAANGRSVTFSKAGQSEYVSECIHKA